MKARRLLTTFLIIVAAFVGESYYTSIAYAAVSDWQKGVSITSRWDTDFGSDSWKQAVNNLKQTGATYIGLVIPVYQSDLHSTDIHNGWNSPTDAALTSAINYAHSIGLHVMLKPHLEVDGMWDWRANIDPWDRDTWYANYSNYLNHLGDIGKQTGVEGITMGTELISVASPTVHSDNTARWQTMIASLRQHFPGYLTYDANWSNGGDSFVDEIKHIQFWSSLDYIGVSAYYPLAADQGSPSVDAIAGSWGYWDQSQLKGISDAYGKKLLFTEVGYKSTNSANQFPCCTGWNGYNGQEQANLYDGLMQYWNDKSYFAGVFFWNWESDPSYGGDGNQDYTPYNKPAEQVLQKWWGSNGSGSITPPPSSSNPPPSSTTQPTSTTPPPSSTPSASSGNWTFTANVPTYGPNQANTISVSTGVSGQATNVIVDFEIYDPSGARVMQKFFEGQNVSAGSPQVYSLPWTSGAAGTYTLKAGVFKSDWSQNFTWNDSVTTIAVGGSQPSQPPTTTTPPPTTTTNNPPPTSSTPPPSGPAVTDVWWPSNGANVTGVQPFKAMLEGRDVNDYHMYWKVDGDVLNEMGNSSTDYPHKEVLVDLSNWKWNAAGTYKLTFVSKDNAGNVISSKDVTITVPQ